MSNGADLLFVCRLEYDIGKLTSVVLLDELEVTIPSDHAIDLAGLPDQERLGRGVWLGEIPRTRTGLSIRIHVLSRLFRSVVQLFFHVGIVLIAN